MTMDGDLSWTAGLYYFHEQGYRDQTRYCDFFGPGGLVGPGSPEIQQSTTTWETDINTDSYAAYAQATYDITANLSATAGLRYSHETKDFDVLAYSIPFVDGGDPYSLFIPDGGFDGNGKESWANTTPSVNLEYKLNDDVMVYISYSEGFKSGGFNGQPDNPNLQAFSPEEVSSYEFGMKGDFFENRVRTTITLFDTDFADLQQQGFSQTGVPITTNAADAHVQGVEVEFEAQLTERWFFGGGFSHVDTEYETFFIEVFDPSIENGPPFRLVDKAGERISLMPKYSANARVSYEQPLSSGALLDWQLDFTTTSDTMTEFDTLWSESYKVFNGSVTLTSSDGQADFSLWVRNINDEQYYRGGGPVPDLNDQISRLGLMGDPRTFGVTLSWRFSE